MPLAPAGGIAAPVAAAGWTATGHSAIR